jgi:hypothetical protein
MMTLAAHALNTDLCGRECDPGEGIAVANDADAVQQEPLQLIPAQIVSPTSAARRNPRFLPSIRGKEEVHAFVGEVARRGQIRVDHLAYRGRPVCASGVHTRPVHAARVCTWEPGHLGPPAVGLNPFRDAFDLSGFARAVQASTRSVHASSYRTPWLTRAL